ncbi:MAG TPA: hypothetical protein VK964_20610 [Nocardioidaceae bacterium]|nr:hypothetical protein [Nocardioidaceae bacterium]
MTGQRSPYATVVIVANDHQTASQKVTMVASGRPRSASSAAKEVTNITSTVPPTT